MSHIHLERTIWPVGHGAFYTEQFRGGHGNTFTVAYDCGGKDKATIEGQIGAATNGGSTPIDLLFISHFHSDHINGLPTLLGNSLVKRIVLPQLAEEVVLEAIVYNFIKASHGGDQTPSADVIQLQEQLISWVQSDNKENITEVVEGADGDGEINHIEIGERNGEAGQVNSVLPKEIRSGKEIQIVTKGNIFWHYIPICYKDKQKCEDLLDALKKKYDITNDQEKLDWKKVKKVLSEEIPEEERKPREAKYKNIKGIKDIYDTIFPAKGKGEQSHNCYSMPVYSGPTIDVALDHIHSSYRYNECLFARVVDVLYRRYFDILANHSSHCLYTGDFEANIQSNLDKLKQILGALWAKVGLLQIPHHISDSNYNPDLYDHRMLSFGNVDDKGDESFSFSIYRKISYSHHCLAVAITEKDEPLEFGYYIVLA